MCGSRLWSLLNTCIYDASPINRTYENSLKLEGTLESAYLRQVKWFKHYYYYYYYNYTLRPGKGRGKEEPLRGRGRESNSRRCCLCCWCNDVIAIISHHLHTHKRNMDRTTNLLISSNVDYVHLGGDNNNR